MSEVRLSASRIKTAQSCSWKYWANYKLKVPQTGNDGSKRGSVCHLIYELLGEEKHSENYNKIIKSGSINGDGPVSRLVKIHAKKLSIDDDDNMELMDMMITKGLFYDFFGGSKTSPTEAISEQKFDIHVKEDGKDYKIYGFIDKLFLYSQEKRAVIRDFKTSKQVFKGKEITDNLQNLIYCLAVKKTFPEYKDIDVEFIFVKFSLDEDLLGAPGKGVLKMERISEDELEGFEYQLTSIQEYLENFSEEDAKSNLAAKQNYPPDKTFGGPLMCGKQGYKKSKGEFVLDGQGNKIKSYICEHRNPLEYYIILNDEGETIASSFKKEELQKSYPDSEVVLEKYEGCPHFRSDAFEI